MKTLAILTALALSGVATAADIGNGCPPKVKGCTACSPCDCATGTCPACPVAKAAPPQPGTLTTASGRLIRQTPTGYVYADDEPQQVLDCSSGKCRWVDAPASRPSYLPAVVPASYAPAASSCASGQCGTARPAAPSVLGPAKRFTFPVK